jgi:cyclic pyranopterin phosphate synthase
MEETLTHLDENGGIRMVDVGHKAQTRRRAVVRAVVQLSAATYALLRDQGLPKGDVLTTAKVAGIQAAKQTSSLIPLCHPLPLSSVDIRFTLDEENARVIIECEARTTGQTGVEMEALIGAQVAAATIYDMCKAVQRDIVVSECRLIHKSGGKSGTYEYKG